MKMFSWNVEKNKVEVLKSNFNFYAVGMDSCVQTAVKSIFRETSVLDQLDDGLNFLFFLKLKIFIHCNLKATESAKNENLVKAQTSNYQTIRSKIFENNSIVAMYLTAGNATI